MNVRSSIDTGARVKVAAVIEAVKPQGLFKVRLDDDSAIDASLDMGFKRVSGKMIPGLAVWVERYPLNPQRGKIVGVKS